MVRGEMDSGQVGFSDRAGVKSAHRALRARGGAARRPAKVALGGCNRYTRYAYCV